MQAHASSKISILSISKGSLHFALYILESKNAKYAKYNLLDRCSHEKVQVHAPFLSAITKATQSRNSSPSNFGAKNGKFMSSYFFHLTKITRMASSCPKIFVTSPKSQKLLVSLSQLLSFEPLFIFQQLAFTNIIWSMESRKYVQSFILTIE